MVTKESTEYEKTMPLPPMPGSIEFIRMLKEHGVQIGLVTSSDNAKVKRAFGLLHLDNLFDTLVTADRITQGKTRSDVLSIGGERLERISRGLYRIRGFFQRHTVREGRRDACHRVKYDESGGIFKR